MHWGANIIINLSYLTLKDQSRDLAYLMVFVLKSTIAKETFLALKVFFFFTSTLKD